jgi:hypothetical protein
MVVWMYQNSVLSTTKPFQSLGRVTVALILTGVREHDKAGSISRV